MVLTQAQHADALGVRSVGGEGNNQNQSLNTTNVGFTPTQALKWKTDKCRNCSNSSTNTDVVNTTTAPTQALKWKCII